MTYVPKRRVLELAWLAALSVAAGQARAADGYLLELLAWCAFSDRELFEPGTMPLA